MVVHTLFHCQPVTKYMYSKSLHWIMEYQGVIRVLHTYMDMVKALKSLYELCVTIIHLIFITFTHQLVFESV